MITLTFFANMEVTMEVTMEVSKEVDMEVVNEIIGKTQKLLILLEPNKEYTKKRVTRKNRA